MTLSVYGPYGYDRKLGLTGRHSFSYREIPSIFPGNVKRLVVTEVLTFVYFLPLASDPASLAKASMSRPTRSVFDLHRTWLIPVPTALSTADSLRTLRELRER